MSQETTSLRYVSYVLILACCCLIFFVARPSAKTIVNQLASVSIKPKQIILVRSGRLSQDSPERKRAVINLPVITGNGAGISKVRAALRLKNLFGTSLAEYKEDAWLTQLDYKVNYNKHFIFDITFTQEGVGAYPDTHTAHFIFNLRSGEIVKAKDVFEAASLTALAQLINDKLQDDVRQIVKDRMERDDLSVEQKSRLSETFSDVKFATENLDDFSVSDQGVAFLYDAGFPHAIKALEPEEQYFLTYAELAPHVSRQGLLARFVTRLTKL